MRCKACNKQLNKYEMEDFHTKKVNDMCTECITLAYSEYSYTSDHEYEHEDVKEGLKTYYKYNM